MYINNELLVDLVIPDNISEIDQYAFYGCDSIKSVTMNEKLTSIKEGAFQNCFNLNNVVINDNIKTIGRNVFDDTNIIDATIPASMIEHVGKKLVFVNITSGVIKSNAFDSCVYLIKATIGEDVAEIKDYAFSNCYKLVEIYNKSSIEMSRYDKLESDPAYYALNVYTPNGGNRSKITISDEGLIYYLDDAWSEYFVVGYIGSEEDVVLPDKMNDRIYEIYKYAFYNNKTIKNIIISNNTTIVGTYAFNNCINLTNISFGSGIELIESYAFASCSYLKELNLPDNIEEIEDYAFSNCNLEKLTVGKNIKKVGANSFVGNSVIHAIVPSKMIQYLSLEKLIRVEITSGSLYEEEFVDCPYLSSIILRSEVERISQNAFVNCHKLVEVINETSLSITGGTSYGNIALNALYISSNSNLSSRVKISGDFIFYINAKDDTYYLLSYIGESSVIVLPSFIGEDPVYYDIYKYAFYNQDIVEVIMPTNVNSLEEYSFGNCTNLSKITYSGTLLNWATKYRDINWRYGVNHLVKVVCSDGETES